jgi:hypothetical protein
MSQLNVGVVVEEEVQDHTTTMVLLVVLVVLVDTEQYTHMRLFLVLTIL